MAAIAEIGWGTSSVRPRSVPDGDRALVVEAQTMGEAALWLLAIAVGRGACEGGLVHCIVPGEPRLVTRAAHAPEAKRTLGATVSMHDAAFLGATRDGANDALTDWARSMTTLRLVAAGLSAIGVLAMALRSRGRDAGLLEVSAPQGRLAFTPTNVAILRELSEAFDARASKI